MNEQELESIWRNLDTRITTINERTKSHTIQIRELQKEIKKFQSILYKEKVGIKSNGGKKNDFSRK